MVLPLSHKCFSFCFLFLFFCCTRKPWDNLAKEYSSLFMLHTQCESLFLNITRVRFQHFFHVKYQVSILRRELKCQRIAVCIAGEGHQEDVTASLAHKLDLGDWSFHTSSPAIGMCTLLAFPMLEAAQGHSLEIVIWRWDHLDWLHDWTQLKSA